MSTLQPKQVRSLDLSAMESLAHSMLRHLGPPLVIGLTGTLGAGKTSLVQAIARSAGVDSADVTSPTFTLLQSYRGSISLHHLDAYRVADEDEFLELGVEELFEDPNAWTLVEWADRVRDVMPRDTLWVRLDIESDHRLRTVSFTTVDPGIEDAVDAVLAEVRLN